MRAETSGGLRAVSLRRGRARRNWAERTNPLLGRSNARPARVRWWSRFGGAAGPAALIGLMAASLVGLQAFLTPAAVTVHHPEHELELTAATAYCVHPRVGALYDSTEPLSGHPHYFTRLVERVEVCFDFLLHSRRAEPYEIRRGVTLDVRAPGLWQKHIVLEPNTPVFSDNGRLTLTYFLDPADLMAQIRDIVKETGVDPGDAPYEVNLVASLETQLGQRRLQAVLSPSFRLLFEPDLEVFRPAFSPQSRVTRALETRELRPNHLTLAGIKVPVVPARLSGVAAAGVLAVWHVSRRRQRRASAVPADWGLERRLVRTRGLAGELRRWPRLYVDNLDDLLRLAAERRRTVLASPPDEPSLYCLLAEGIAYIHVPDAGPRHDPLV